MSSVKMSKGHRLRALVNERLSAAAEEIFALFERTIAEYEEELCRSKEETQSKQELLDSMLRPPKSPDLDRGLDHEPDRGLSQDTQTSRIKEEPEEHSVKEENELPEDDPESSVVCVKIEESLLLQRRQTEHREETPRKTVEGIEESSDTDNDEDWRETFSCSAAQMKIETDEDHYNEETGVSMNYAHMSGTAEGAEGKRHQCPMCMRRFGSKQDLERHIRVHTGERPFSCSICKRTFNRKGNLDRHVMMHTGERSYSCSTCEKTFTQKSHLEVHLRMHTGERPFSCSTCKKTFTHKANLDQHVRIHTRKRPFSCTLCEKSFTQKANLDQHVRIHTGEKPYSCSTCDKTFTHKYSLDVHVTTHTGDRPYSCSVCEKRFVQKCNLDKHMRTHTGERPYSCSICNKWFTQNSSLKTHMMRSHVMESD